MITCHALIWCSLGSVFCPPAYSQSALDLPQPPSEAVVEVTAGRAVRWREGVYDVYVLFDGCDFRQATTQIKATAAVLWIERGEEFGLQPHRVIAYFQEPRRVDSYPDVENGQVKRVTTLEADAWLGRFFTHQELNLPDVDSREVSPVPKPPIYHQAVAARSPSSLYDAPTTTTDVRPIQFVQPLTTGPSSMAPQLLTPDAIAPTVAGPASPDRSVQFFQRSSIPLQAEMLPSPDGQGNVAVITGGVNVIIRGLDQLGTIDIATDRMVIWSGGGGLNVSSAQSPVDGPMELYMEGNIVFRQADRVIRATSMYYHVNQEQGVVLNAEMLAPVQGYEGMIRLKADVLRQIGRGSYQGHGAAITSSRLGVPRYWFQTENVTLEDYEYPALDPLTAQPLIDRVTGDPIVQHQRLAASRNNWVYVAGMPVFYWPRFRTDFTQPAFYVDSVSVGNDNVFGTQVRVDLNMYQLFGIGNPIAGTKWTSSVDYLSERGWGLGNHFEYEVEQFARLRGPTYGVIDAWGIGEQGLDNLGADRRALVPEEDFRGRLLWQHRQRLWSGWQITGEIGAISDRNFLEQYYELEWDQWKDQTTGLELKRITGPGSLNMTADLRVNDFFTQTNWLPRLDYFHLGQSTRSWPFVWHHRSHVGYADLETASTPVDPADAAKFNLLAWETDRQGIRAGTRHELDWPVDWGPSKIVPYVLGDVTFWGEDINGNSVSRLFGQAGVKWSMPMWRVDSTINSELFNLSGLAHKVVFETEFLWADANENLDRFPLYDPLDDNSVEHFRRRFIDDTFGGLAFVDEDVPLRFDERLYALRTLMQGNVSASSLEIADDLLAIKLGARQRWQTKRGMPGQQRIIDWITLDTQSTLFPDSERDNFGAMLGLANYDLRWHIGDRLTLVSDGYADTFGQGLRTISLGGYISRPERGSMYMGLRSIEGPISSNVLTSALRYRMSEKWIAAFGTVVDLGATGNIGQHFELTRIGESFLVSVGANVDASRDNVGFGFTIEPRFMPFSRRGLLGGVQLPPAGARGLE